MAHRIGLLEGNGVGKEVVPEARRAVEALGVAVDWTVLPWGTDHWHATGRMMPADGLDRLREFDATSGPTSGP